MKDRRPLYGTAQAALQDIADAHAADVTLAAEAVGHLAEVLTLVGRLGLRTTWAKDTETMERATAFLATIAKEDDHGNDTENHPHPGPAGGPARAGGTGGTPGA